MSDLQDIRTVPAADVSQRRLHDRVFRPIEPAFSLIGVEDRNPRSGLGHTEGFLEGIVAMSTRVENVAIVLGNHIPTAILFVPPNISRPATPRPVRLL